MKKIKIKFYLISLNLILLCLIIVNFKNKKIKIGICTMAKNENLYIKDFIEYYIKLGVDHIFIYDDNEPNQEKISEKIDKSFNSYITIYKNFKDIKKQEGLPPIQPLIFTKCYNLNKDKYDWFLMIDLDEYLVIVKDKLKNYLSRKVFKNCDFIKIHWVQPTDNNLLHYDNRSLFERFKRPYKTDGHIKSIIRGHIKELKFLIHTPYMELEVIFSPILLPTIYK